MASVSVAKGELMRRDKRVQLMQRMQCVQRVQRVQREQRVQRTPTRALGIVYVASRRVRRRATVGRFLPPWRACALEEVDAVE